MKKLQQQPLPPARGRLLSWRSSALLLLLQLLHFIYQTSALKLFSSKKEAPVLADLSTTTKTSSQLAFALSPHSQSSTLRHPHHMNNTVAAASSLILSPVSPPSPATAKTTAHKGALTVPPVNPITAAASADPLHTTKTAFSTVSANISTTRTAATTTASSSLSAAAQRESSWLPLTGKTAFVAGIGDSNGYGWAIARELAAAGARVAIGTWPPVLNLFTKSFDSGKFDKDRILPDGSLLQFTKIYPLDAAFDSPEDVPTEIKENKRYAGVADYTISQVAASVHRDLGEIDILVHSLANGPEVQKPLLETSREGYLAAVSNSAFSMVSLLQRFGPFMKEGGSALTLSYIAAEKVIPGYGGGMSSAKAALESDTRVLAWESGRKFKLRVNAISAGPLRSRAAQAIGQSGDKFIDYAVQYSLNNSPLQRDLRSEDVASAALFLLSPAARAITGVTLYVDNGLHAMGHAVDSRSLPYHQQ